jgi:pyruvate formate lyase activating enzyme
MRDIEREIPFYEESHGGVTFSGGEPLMQPTFLLALLQACRAREIHTVVDTSGFANWRVFQQIHEEVDLYLYDLKHMNSLRHKEITGVPNNVILENLRRLHDAGAKCIVRIPLIPGINDDEENIIDSGKFLAGLPHILGVELMGYHDIAQAKYVALGREYPLTGTKPPTEAAFHHAADVLRIYGLNVVLR